MLESVNVVKRIVKYVTSTKYQQQFRIFCLRKDIFRIRTVRKKQKLCNMSLFFGGLLIKPVIGRINCQDQIVSLNRWISGTFNILKEYIVAVPK